MFWQVFCANIIKGLLSDKLLVAPIFTTRSDFFNIIFPITNGYHVFSSLFGFPTDIFSPSHLNFWNWSGSTLSGFLIYSDQLQVSTAHRSDESVYENLIDGQQNHIYKRMLVLCYNFAFGQITHCSQRRSILKCSQFYSSKSAYVSLLCKFSDKRAEISAWVMEGEGIEGVVETEKNSEGSGTHWFPLVVGTRVRYAISLGLWVWVWISRGRTPCSACQTAVAARHLKKLCFWLIQTEIKHTRAVQYINTVVESAPWYSV